MDINILPLTEEKTPPVDDFGFGNKFSNRMFTQKYTEGVGWHDAQIRPYGPVPMELSTAVLHYAQEIFEGTKAYRRPDGNINLFRPWENAARFNRSAQRMVMPVVDEEDHVAAIIQLIEMEHDWVPGVPGSSLYIRPAMIATDTALGVHASKTYLHFIILSPVGAYFKEGFNPIPVYISDEYRRAVKGGTGEAKTGGNYAASLYVSEAVKAEGYSQVLWLDAVEGRYIEEVGAMNICFVYGNKQIVTPKLSGSILPGITRKSILHMAPDLGYEASEETLDVDDMIADLKSGKITEVFGCGTAAVIAPVGKFGYKGEEIIINNNESGPVATHLFDQLTGIQTGRLPDPYGWTQMVEVG